MRKDVKVGLASGGVLLAVVAVYASSLNKQSSATKGGKPLLTLSNPSGSGASNDSTAAKRSGGPITIETSNESERPIAGAPVGSTAVATAEPSDTDWSRILETGAPPALMTRTPAPGESPKPNESQRTVDVFADTTASPKPAVVGTADPSSVGGVAPVVIDRGTRTAPSLSATATSGGTGATANGSSSTPATGAATAGLTASATPGMRTYVIKTGDSFYTIARDLYGNSHFYPHISRANPDLDPARIKPGMTINVPDPAAVKPTATNTAVATGSTTPVVNTLMASGTSTPSNVKTTATTSIGANEYRVGPNDNLYRIAAKLYDSPKKMQEIYDLNKATIGEDPSKLKVGMVLKLPAGAKTSN